VLYAWLLSSVALVAVSVWGTHRFDEGQYAIVQNATLKAQAAAVIQNVKDGAALAAAEEKINSDASRKFAEIQMRILGEGETLTREVKVYVTQKSVAACTLSLGVIRMLDAAASGDPRHEAAFPVPAGQSNDTLTAVGIDTLSARIAANYTNAIANAAQLDALNAWIADAIAKYNAPAK